MLIHETLRLKRWCPSAWRKSAKQTEAEHRVTRQFKPELSSSGSPLIRCHHCGIPRCQEGWDLTCHSWTRQELMVQPQHTNTHTTHTLFNIHTQIQHKESLSECELCHLYLRSLPVASEARSTPLCQRITVYIYILSRTLRHILENSF